MTLCKVLPMVSILVQCWEQGQITGFYQHGSVHLVIGFNLFFSFPPTLYVCIINPSHPCYWTINTTFTCFKCKIKPPVKRVTKSSRNVSDLDNIHKVTKTNFPRHHCFSSSLNLKAISCSSRNYIFCNIHPLWICFIFHIYW